MTGTSKIKYLYLLIFAVILTACSSDKKSDIAFYIPKDASAVINFNFANLHKDGKLSDFNKTKMYTQITSLLGMYAPDIKKGLETMAENSDNTGLDLKADAYYFFKDHDTGIILPMKNETTFLKFAKSLTGNKGALAKEPKKIDNFLTVQLSDTQILAWNSFVVMMYEVYNANYAEVEKKFKTLINMKDEESITSTPEFAEFAKNKKDISLMCDYGKLLSTIEEISDTKGAKIPEILKGMTCTAYLDFATDEVTFSGNVNFSKETAAKFDVTKIYKSTMNGKLFKYVPNDAVAGYISSVNMPEFLKYMQATLSELPNSAGSDAEIFSTFKTVLSALQLVNSNSTGEMFCGMIGFKDKELALGSIAANPFVDFSGAPTPVFALIIETTKDGMLGNIAPLLPKMKKSGNYYTVPIFEDISVTIAEANGAILISNDAGYLNDAIAGKFQGSGFGKGMKANSGFIKLNPEYMPENFKQFMANDPFLGSVTKIFSAFDIANFESGADGKSFSATLKFKPTGNNAFYQFMQMIEKAI